MKGEVAGIIQKSSAAAFAMRSLQKIANGWVELRENNVKDLNL